MLGHKTRSPVADILIPNIDILARTSDLNFEKKLNRCSTLGMTTT